MPSIPQQRRMELNSIRRCFITYRESDANTDFPTLYSSLHFNQRTRMGCDLQRLANSSQFTGFNPRTHMGCDSSACRFCQLAQEFQSTHPHGVRHRPAQVVKVRNKFQSTHPHGVRLSPHRRRQRCNKCFNPRTRTGCDFRDAIAHYSPKQFQSTHPHGVRLMLQLQDQQQRSFNPRTRTGCDRILSNELNVIVQIYRICE